MFRCHVCGKTESRQELLTEVFDIEGKSVQVEQIPATVCLHCGEPVFIRDATSEFGAWFMEKQNLSSRFRWTYSPIGNIF